MRAMLNLCPTVYNIRGLSKTAVDFFVTPRTYNIIRGGRVVSNCDKPQNDFNQLLALVVPITKLLSQLLSDFDKEYHL